ncbi:MAG: hypothetical protein OEZ22_06350 [Spirochaetia bacterium]|nr:hypothetical protein [Spirochaetia bacterium]
MWRILKKQKPVEFSFLFFLFVLSCSTVQHNYLEETAVNYTKTGFISEDIFQVVCSLQYEEHKELNENEKRKLFLENCRKKIVVELIVQKIKYDFNSEFYLNKPKNSSNVSIETKWDEENVNLLLNHYSDILPGYLVYETYIDGNYTGTYRISSENLIEKVSKREMPFAFEVEY